MRSSTPIRTPVNELGTILSIWAHPDDETYLAGGIMAAARASGQRVVCASASAGELGTADPHRWPPARLGAVRRWEASAAMAVLGVAEHHIKGLPDGALADHEEEGVAWAEHLLTEMVPDTILTFGPDGVTYHADHQAVCRWVTQAWRNQGCRSRLLYATSTTEHLDRFGELYEQSSIYMTDERPTGVPQSDATVHITLDGDALDQKFVALRAMASQTGDLVDTFDVDLYRAMIADETFLEAAMADDRAVDQVGHMAEASAPVLDLSLKHLNLTVADLDRSVDFYRTWFGFTSPARRYPDGTVFLGNHEGFDLALHPDTPDPVTASVHPDDGVHFGFRATDPATVRSLRDKLKANEIKITEAYDTTDFVNVKCLDPDGYEIEVYWEPPSR